MAIIRSFRDLNVYQNARIEARSIFQLSQSFPREERFSLTDQIRRSSRAVKSMIAEAWGHRRYRASFVNKATDALGEVKRPRRSHGLMTRWIAATSPRRNITNMTFPGNLWVG